MIKKIRYLLEFIIVLLALLFFRIIGVKNASNIGSFLARKIGKIHSTNKLARNNIQKALLIDDDNKIEQILDDMWDNLGRIVGEYAYISSLKPKDLIEKHVIIDQKTKENIEFIKNNNDKKGGIIFSAHIGNWEIGPKSFIDNEFDVKTVYRPLNNPLVENITAKMRGTKLIAKGSKGNREIINAIKEGKYVIILADQKISEGERIKFFHDDAITTTSLARIALKYNIDLIPARSIRMGRDVKFQVEIDKPLQFDKSDNLNNDILSVTRLINKKLEDWIKQYPSQWFWVHDRWKK